MGLYANVVTEHLKGVYASILVLFVDQKRILGHYQYSLLTVALYDYKCVQKFYRISAES